MELTHLERTAVCSQEKLRYLAFGAKKNFLDTLHFCRTLTGDIAVTRGPESVKSIQEALESIGGRLVGLLFILSVPCHPACTPSDVWRGGVRGAGEGRGDLVRREDNSASPVGGVEQ